MRALVDSGTSTTRLRLVVGGRLCWSGTRPVGARDVAVHGPGVLREAIAELLAEARPAGPVSELVCWGMITSNAGLLEVPHVPAPAGVEELARAVRQVSFEDFGVPCAFIPGVRTVPERLSWSTLDRADVLRGEEVEVLGLRALLGLDRATFLHLGSHPKRIELDAAGRVSGSRTALSGELAAALAGHTVLAGSVLPPEQWVALPEEPWREGLRAAHEHGVGRALFLVRLGQLLLGADPRELSAYLLGVVSALTLDLLSPAGSSPLLIYGPPQLAGWLAGEARGLGWAEVRVVAPDELLRATLLGAEQIMDQALRVTEDRG